MGAGARLTIDLGALMANYRELARRAAPAKCAAVVKADAYGIGLEKASRALAAAGCTVFFVATPDEAVRLRKSLSAAVIYVLDGLLPGAAGDFAAYDLRPVLGSPEEIDEWAEFCASHDGAPGAALHIDTGMNRLGLNAAEVKIAGGQAERLEAVNVVLVMSHLACADTPNHPLNRQQLAAFNELRALLPDAPASIANSAGIMLGKPWHLDLVRPGIALYGGEAVGGIKNPMQPVISIEAQIVRIRDVKPGESIGYGAAYKCRAASRIATLPIGYADGIFRNLGAAGMHVCVSGHPAPIVGRISMDLITIDVSGIPEKFARRGAWAELAGGHNKVDDLARRAGTIGYEVLTSLGKRYERVYVDAL